MRLRRMACGALTAGLVQSTACAFSGSAHPMSVLPASPKEDGKAAGGGEGGVEHAAALEQLKISPLGWRTDPQYSVRVPLPDASRWLRVKFWGFSSLVGFRYGKAHHAIVAGVVTHVDDEMSPGACDKAFEHSTQPWVDSFDVALDRDPPQAFLWKGKIVDVDSLVATAGTLGLREQYAIAYAAFPAWKGACLVLGIAVPSRDELARSKAVRDRFVAEVLPKVEVTRRIEPKGRF